MRNYVGVVASWLTASVALAEPSCFSFPDVLSASLTFSDTVKLQATETVVAEAQSTAAKAAVMPSIKAAGSFVRQDDSAVSSSKSKPENWQTTARLALTQPIYAGGAEYATLRKAKVLADSARLQAEAAKIKVARDATTRFYQLLMAQAELRSITELRDVSRRRAKDIKNRVAIGRSRAAEGLGADAQVASSEAQYEAAKMAVDTARRSLAALVGRVVESACDSSNKSSLPFKSWDEVREKISKRPDIVAADLALTIAKENVEVARSGHRPSVDFGANYYVKRPNSQSSLGKWDVALSATLPLYSGGMVSAKVNESQALESKQELQSKILKTNAADEGREIWETYSNSKGQMSSLELAAEKSSKYYAMMAQDEKKGLTSSLEALQALNASIDAQRAAQKAKLRIDESSRQILLLTGTIEGAAL